jgi:predicted GNAT family N-acyltransferase
MKDQRFNGYTLSCKRRRFRLGAVEKLLKLTYWAKDRDRRTSRISLRHSHPYGVFDPAGKLVGFLRVTSDMATVYYIADVVVAEEERGKGLGLALVRYALTDTRVCRGKGMLLTQTAVGLYAKVGFYQVSDRLMVRDPVHKYTDPQAR